MSGFIAYDISKHIAVQYAALVDRGVNAYLIGEDMMLLEIGSHIVDVVGIEDHQVINLPVGTAAVLTHSQYGDVIIIVHQGAYRGKGRSILSAGQLEHFKNCVSDQSVVVGGCQAIFTHDGHSLPLSI